MADKLSDKDLERLIEVINKIAKVYQESMPHDIVRNHHGDAVHFVATGLITAILIHMVECYDLKEKSDRIEFFKLSVEHLSKIAINTYTHMQEEVIH